MGLSILNPHPQPLPGPALLHQLVARRGDNDDVAIDYLGPDGNREQITYVHLHQRADRLAAWLCTLRNERPSSTKRSFIIPIFIAQSPDLYIAQLATLKAGAAFCPISLDVPEERLRFIVQDVDADVLLTTSALRKSLPALEGLTIVSADDNWDGIEGTQGHIQTSPSSPAYIMYTSGSTGQPKGVVLSHTAATQALLAHERHIPRFTRFLQFASPTFDVSVFEIFFPFFRQATLVCGDRRRLLSDLPGFINNMNVDAAELTPSVASSLLHGRSSVPGLKSLLTIGEMLKQDVVEEFGGCGNETAILHGMYGPTEATIHCTLQPSFRKDMAVRNIGVPLDTVSAFVVQPAATDQSNAPPKIVAFGEEGELAVGGHQLADEYLNRPEQTRSVFVEHPEHGLLYRTGDRARMTQCGSIECLGRISSGQVKLRGQRIELGEIEYAASKTPGCQSAVAEVVSGTLTVFVTGRTSTVNRSELLETCRKWLPGFMVPGDAVLLESLPYLASGKVDRKALHSIYSQQRDENVPGEDLVSPRLRTIIDTVSSVLDTHVGASQPLASSGLDSLSAIRIASRLRKIGMPGLDATILLEARTLREIEQAFEIQAQALTDSLDGSIEHDVQSQLRQTITAMDEIYPYLDDIQDVIAPTAVQTEMLSETARDNKAYCNWIELALPGTMAADYVNQCLSKISGHHELLRSGFVSLDDINNSYAMILWRSLLPEQVKNVDCFDRNPVVGAENDLLRPLEIQLLEGTLETRVLFKIHHALYDNWSMDVLKTDLNAIIQGQEIHAASSFQDLSNFHLKHDETHSEASLDFWQANLSEFSPTLLPVMTGKRASAKLERTGWQAIGTNIHQMRTAAQGIGCSLPAVYQTALAYLLGAYTGTSDVTLGTVFSGRHLPVDGIERLFGPCLSTLPLRVDHGTTRSVRDLLWLVHDQSRAVQKHSRLPISRIKAAAGIDSEIRLFDVLFVWQETTLNIKRSETAVREIDSADEHDFSLVLEFEPSDDGVVARATYQRSHLTSQQVHLMMQQLKILSNVMLQQPDGLVKELSRSLPDAALSLWNTSPRYCGPGHDLIRAIEHHAATIPDQPALTFYDKNRARNGSAQTLNYNEVNLRANRVAHYLRSLNVQAAKPICICMEKSVDLYVAILATLKAGCGYLPLLPDVPPARLASIFGQSHIDLCLSDADAAQRIKRIVNAQVVDVATIDFGAFSSANLPFTISGSDVAYTVYTSGSTGEPKGVAVTASNLLGNLQTLAELYHVQTGDRLLQACSQAFDVSVFEIFFSFYTGICLCSARKDVLFADLEGSIRDFGITHLSLTPTVAALIHPDNVRVKFLVTAGEAVTELVHERWAGRGLHQGYGPSETTNICTINMNTQPDDMLGNIGPPFINTSAFVLVPGPGFDVLPAGAVGEFAFGGEQVFKGYVGMDNLNAEKIVLHPSFGRVYKSGDVGRILHDGTLLISGRLDEQVKIRGNRIELGEINAALLQDSGVHDCTTLTTGNAAAEQDLVSFVVLHSTPVRNAASPEIVPIDPNAVERLFTILEDAVPAYMIPSMIIAVDRLPLTTQGKLDRRLLKNLLHGLESQSKARYCRNVIISEPSDDWTDMERSIAGTLTDGLSVESSSITRQSSFFSLGLNSLNAISFAKHLSRSVGRPINPGVILRNPSISRLARQLDRHSLSDTNIAIPQNEQLLPTDLVQEISRQFPQEEIEAVLPCTPLQEAMVSASATSASSYCNTTWIQVFGSVQKLKACWQKMVARHGILRTCFARTESSSHPFVQVVFAKTALRWAEYEVDSLADMESVQSSLHEKISELVPFRIGVCRSPTGTKMGIEMHHAIYDGLSMVQLFREVEATYEGISLPPPSSFTHFLRLSRAQNVPSAIEFWASKLNGLHPSPFPRSETQRRSREHTLDVGAMMQQARLDSYCKRYGTLPLSVLQAALVKVVSHAQAITDVCIGNVVSGRTVPVEGIERLVAPCFNTVPVRTDLGKIRSNIDLVQHLAQSNLDSVDFQLSPLRRLQSLSADPSNRLFDAILLLQPSDLRLDDSIWRIERDFGSMGLPLVFEISPKGENFLMSVHHLEAVVTSSLAERLSRAYVAALQNCLDYPSSDLRHFAEESTDGLHGALAPIQKIQQVNGAYEDDVKVAPHDWTPEESMVREVFARFSNVKLDRISRETSMYQLGLDSLNAPQVASRIRSQGYAIDAADILESLTPRRIAKLMESKQCSRTEESFDLQSFDERYRSRLLEHLQDDSHDILKVRPVTSVQSGMLAQSLQTAGDLYVNHVTYAIPPGVSDQELHAAWTVVMSKHELLRAGFYDLQDPKWPFIMVVRSPGTVKLPFNVCCDGRTTVQTEQTAKGFVIDSIERSPWHITLCQRAMTLSIHHALYDAESLQIVLSDLQQALKKKPIGKASNVDSLLTSTISAEQQALNSSDAEGFWLAKLQDVVPVKMPDLNPTTTAENHLLVDTVASGLRLAQIESYCREHETTVQGLGQTIWAVLLAAYTGEDSPTFGTVFSSRDDNPAWQTAFPSVVTVPVTCNISSGVHSLAKEMAEYNGSTRRHRYTPLAEIQRFAGQAGRPMFDTVFVYQKTSSQARGFDWPIERETAGVDYVASLELEIDTNESIHFRLTYQTARIPPAQGRVMVEQYNMMMEETVLERDRKPGSPTTDLFSMVAAKTPEISSEVQLMHQFVERGASAHPNSMAFEFVSSLDGHHPHITQWTYAQLDITANRIANAILDAGARPGSVVALCMDKCPEATFAFVGILKAGCAFLALDPDLPQDRIMFILEDSGATALLTNSLIRPLNVPQSVVSLDISLQGIEKHSKTAPKLPQRSPKDTCYVLYTSGTTGTPKGCEITHENAVQAMLAFQRLFAGHWTESSRWLQFASYWFDVSVLEQFWSWSVGISVVGAPRDLVLEDISAFVRELRITHIDLTPSLARLVEPADVPSLWGGVFITGGEALKQEIIDAWGSKHTVCNGYGPTEATIGVTMNTFIGENARPSNIGRAFDNVGAHVLDSDGHTPVIRGGVGELCVSGKLVGKGYLNRPELTEKQFPFVKELGERFYRTGDLVRLLHDNSFQFIGRRDTQAKLRGQRLEIGEIDAVIRQSAEHVADVLTLVTKDRGGKETLVSFLVLNDRATSLGLEIDLADDATTAIRKAASACEQKLARYMVPTHIIPLLSLPLTVNNKVDTKRLTKLFEALDSKTLQHLRHSDHARPLTPQEMRVCEVLSSMFPIDLAEIRNTSNLFSLGLSSISAISYASALKRAGFPHASVATILRNQTVDQLAVALAQVDHSAGHAAEDVKQAKLTLQAYSQRCLGAAAMYLELQPDEIESITPCTPLQQGLILESYRDDSRPYFNRFDYRLHNVDFAHLEGACRRLVKEVPMLRSSFAALGEGHCQVIHKRKRPQIAITRSDNAAESTLESLVKDKVRHWLSANAEALVSPCEFHLMQVSGAQYFVILLHHAVYDAISYELLLQLLWQIFRNDKPIETGPSFFTALAHGPLKHTPGSEDFWKQRLHGFAFSPLPSIRERTGQDPHARRSLPSRAVLEQRRQELGVSHQAMSQALFEVALRQFTATQHIRSYGIVVSGRSIELEGADKVLGPMFNTLPQPIHVRPANRLSDHIRRCHQMNSETLPYQHTALRSIRKWAGRRTFESMFDVLFVFQHTPADQGTVQHENEKLCTPIERPSRAEFPLVCEVTSELYGSLALTLVAQSQYLTEADLEVLMTKLEELFETVATEPDARLGERFAIEQVSLAEDLETQQRYPSHVNGVVDFEWTKEANDIRSTLARMAGVSDEDVDEHTSIFSIGLDSIDAVKLASRLRKVGLSLPVSKILRAQTIPGMLRHIQSRDEAAETQVNNRLDQLQKALQANLTASLRLSQDVERILPATPHQEALIADMLRSDFNAYLNHDVLQLGPQVDLQRVRAAWQTVVDVSPLLRTSFLQVEDPKLSIVFAQCVRPTQPLAIPELQFGNLAEIRTYLDQVKADVSRTMEHTPPFRLAFASVKDTRYLLVTLAHCMYDGHSLALLHEDVHRAYMQTLQARPSYDGSVNASLAAAEDDSLRFWSSALAGSKPKAFLHSDVANEDHEVHRSEINSELAVETIRSFCQQEGISMQAMAQNCWALTLAHYTRSLEVLFGVVLACRDSEEAERIMFPLMNTVVMRSSLHGSRAEMLQYTQNAITEMLPYQRTPLRAVQKACVSQVEVPTVAGLFDTLFTYQHRPSPEAVDEDALYHSVGGNSNVDYPVAVEMEAVGDQFVIRAACKSSALDERGTHQLLNTVDRVLRSVIASPERLTVDLRDGKAAICGLTAFDLDSPRAGPNANGLDSTDRGGEEIESSPLVNEILEVFAQVSGLEKSELSPVASIESIGIDSIAAIKVTSLLRKRGIKLSVSSVVSAKTASRIAALASKTSEAPTSNGKPSDHIIRDHVSPIDVKLAVSNAGLNSRDVEVALPISAGQAYMLRMWSKTGGQTFYATFTYRVPSNISDEEVRTAWKILVKRHPILRTVFAATSSSTSSNTQILQLVLRQDWALETSKQQPMVAVSVRAAGDGLYLDLGIHHALYDAVSLHILMHDMECLLARRPLNEPTIRYEDFLATLATHDIRVQQKDFWIKYLDNIKPMKLPQPAVDGAQEKVEIFQPGLFRQAADLDSISRRERLSIQALLFAAYGKVYSTFPAKTGDAATDVVVGVYLANRSHLPDLDSLAAPTLNLLPLLIRSPQQKTLLDIAKQIQIDLQKIGRPENSAASLQDIAEWTAVKVDTFVNFLKLPERSSEEAATDGSVKIEEVSDRRRATRREVSKAVRTGMFEPPPELRSMRHMDAYQHSVDIEMTVTDGKLDVGLFAPGEMLSLEEADAAIGQLKELLESLVNGGTE